MKSLFIICVILSLFGCRYDPTPSDSSIFNILNNDSSVAQIQDTGNHHSSITFTTITNCISDEQRPNLIFVDMQTGDLAGPFKVDTALINKVGCITGHQICWGAWIGKANYYDCSQAETTHECYLVEWNEDYQSWGCTRNCYDYSEWNCYACNDNQTVKHIYLNCGEIY